MTDLQHLLCMPSARNSMRRHVVASANALAGCIALLGATAMPAQVTKPAAAAASTSAAQQSEPIIVNRVSAVVNSESILLSKVMERVIRMRDPNSTPDSATLAALEKTALQDLIDDALLVQKAKAEKIQIIEADLQQAVDAEIKDVRGRFKGAEPEFLRALKESGFGSVEDFRKTKEDEFRREFYKRDIIAKFKRDGKIAPAGVSEADVTAELERSKDQLAKKPATVGFRQIVFPLAPSEASKKKARARIDSLRKEVEARPGDFESIAKRESMDPSSKELGGDLGWNRRGVMLPEFDRAMFTLNPGVISPIVETGYGYHIIRVDKVQAAEVKARHILISFAVDSLDEARAKKLADSIAVVWRAGANYDTLSAHYHDEGNAEARSLPEFPRDELPVSYQTAIAGHKVNDIVGPFTIDDPTTKLKKPVLLQLTKMEEIGEYSVSEMRQRIRTSLSEFRGTRRFLDGLRAEAFVWTYQEAAAKKPTTR